MMDSKLVGSTILLGAAATTLAVVWLANNNNKKKTTEEQLDIQWYPGTVREFFSHFFTWDGPQHMLETFRKLQDCVFRVRLRLPGAPPLYLVADSNLARTVLEKATSSKFDDASRFFIETTNGMNFIASSHEQRWKHVRKSTVAAFSGDNMKLMIQVVENVLKKWIQDNLESDDKDGSGNTTKGGNEIYIVSEMNKITSNVICDAAFDYELTDEERKIMLADLQVCWKEFGQESGKNLLRQNRYIKWMFAGVREGQRAAKNLHAFCHKMLLEYRAKISTSDDKNAEQPHKIIHMINSDPDYKNDDERICDMVAFVIAGFDTTANTLAFCFRELAMNQVEQNKLRDTLRRQCKTPEEARMAVKNVTREIMRLYPAAALGSVRILGEDIFFPVAASASARASSAGEESLEKKKRFLPKGSLVITAYYSIQRDQTLFGKDVDEFVPSRWEQPTTEQTKAMLAFSTGKRNCLGQSLAMAEMTEVVARLCKDYKFDIVEAGRPELLVLFKPMGTILKATKVE